MQLTTLNKKSHNFATNFNFELKKRTKQKNDDNLLAKCKEKK